MIGWIAIEDPVAGHYGTVAVYVDASYKCKLFHISCDPNKGVMYKCFKCPRSKTCIHSREIIKGDEYTGDILDDYTPRSKTTK